MISDHPIIKKIAWTSGTRRTSESIETHREYVGYLDEWDGTEVLTDEEIVRCRDCKYAVVRHPLNPITGVPAGIEDWRCDYFWNADELCEVDPTGFCAWGERRDA